MRNQRAFSMIELAVLIAVTGITASVGLATFSTSLARYRADKAATRLATDIHDAKRTAARASAASGIAFQPATAAYRPTGGWTAFADGSTSIDLTESPFNAQLVENTFPAGVIAFDAYANPLASGAIDLANGSFLRRVSLDKDSGAIAIDIMDTTGDPDPDPDPTPAPPITDADPSTRTTIDVNNRVISTRSVVDMEVPSDERMSISAAADPDPIR